MASKCSKFVKQPAAQKELFDKIQLSVYSCGRGGGGVAWRERGGECVCVCVCVRLELSPSPVSPSRCVYGPSIVELYAEALSGS